MSELAKMDKNVEKQAREQLLNDVMNYLIDKGYPCDRITDYGTIGVQVNDIIFALKFVIPIRFDKDGNEKWSLDGAIEDYEIRVAKDRDKERLKKEKEAISRARQAKAAEQTRRANLPTNMLPLAATDK